MKYYGSIIDFDNFKGPVKIQKSTFERNIVKYLSCNLAASMDTATNLGTDRYPTYGTTKDNL